MKLTTGIAVAFAALSAACAEGPTPTTAPSLGTPVAADNRPVTTGSISPTPVWSAPSASPAAPPFGAASNARPAPQPAQAVLPPIQRTDETKSVTVSPDGRSMRTETTRTTVGIDPNKAVEAAARILGGAQGGANQGIPGVWQAQSSSNRSMCSVQLYGSPTAASGAAASSGCSFGGALSGLSGWRYQNGQLELLKGETVSLRLNQLGPNRFDGQMTWGPLTTTIALYR